MEKFEKIPSEEKDIEAMLRCSADANSGEILLRTPSKISGENFKRIVEKYRNFRIGNIPGI